MAKQDRLYLRRKKAIGCFDRDLVRCYQKVDINKCNIKYKLKQDHTCAPAHQRNLKGRIGLFRLKYEHMTTVSPKDTYI